MTRRRNILYAGANFAGVSTSVRFVAKASGIRLTLDPRLELDTTWQGTALRIRTDVRTSHYFESAVDGLARCALPDADEHKRVLLRPRLAAHLDYLKIVDGIVFVLDSQEPRFEANRERLDMVKTDLATVGRLPSEIQLVFQCNKQDVPMARPIAEAAAGLGWPRSEIVPSVATTGEGVMDALGVLLRLELGPTGSPPYR